MLLTLSQGALSILLLRLNRLSHWCYRVFSTNAKMPKASFLYLRHFSAFLGIAFSMLIRLQLAIPSNTFILDYQFYNVVITAHALLMIFFFVIPAPMSGFGTISSRSL